MERALAVSILNARVDSSESDLLVFSSTKADILV